MHSACRRSFHLQWWAAQSCCAGGLAFGVAGVVSTVEQLLVLESMRRDIVRRAIPAPWPVSGAY
jgi:hypothetical protein